MGASRTPALSTVSASDALLSRLAAVPKLGLLAALTMVGVPLVLLPAGEAAASVPAAYPVARPPPGGDRDDDATPVCAARGWLLAGAATDCGAADIGRGVADATGADRGELDGAKRDA